MRVYKHRIEVKCTEITRNGRVVIENFDKIVITKDGLTIHWGDGKTLALDYDEITVYNPLSCEEYEDWEDIEEE